MYLLFLGKDDHVPFRHSGDAGVLKGLPSRTISLLWQVEPNVTINDARCARDLHDSLFTLLRNKEGNSAGYIFLESSLNGVIYLSDLCRTGAKELEGALDIIHSSLLPEDKAKNIQDFQNDAPTTMAEDGNNDAPTLATLDVGILV
nr:putative inactive cadmium/zinc-transporting ATPase HMA3 [Tanacetum cinerariifolium]